jgi:hypothetical protein
MSSYMLKPFALRSGTPTSSPSSDAAASLAGTGCYSNAITVSRTYSL